MTTNTFDNLWLKYEPRRVRGKKSQGETTRLYEKHVAPKFGGRLVNKITFEEADDLHADLRDTPYQANRVIALMRVMYKYAEALQWVPAGYNPAKAVRAFPEKKRRRHMKPREAPRISLAIHDQENYTPLPCLFLWLLIFTGARSGEIKSAKWSDLDGDVLILDKHKTDQKGEPRIIVLPKAAIDKLNKLAPVATRNPAARIIPMAKPEYLWQRNLRHKAKVPDLRVHDLRHTFGTYALDHGYSLDQIGEALNHANVATTKIYAELTHRKRRDIADNTSLAILHDMQIVEDDR